MSIIGNYFEQAQLALAAYANLSLGMSSTEYVTELESAGMSEAQAATFASEWTVIATLDDTLTDTQATVFKNIVTGKNVLAIRGTSSLIDGAADAFILNGTPIEFNFQYKKLKEQVQSWIDNGILTTGFTVTGHSLGGYLATGIVADFSTEVSQAYLYNAPGNSSTLSQVLQFVGITNTPDPTKITSIRADSGISPIAALGSDVVIPTSIAIENQFLSDEEDWPLALNHSQQILTDSLAVYAKLAEFDPNLNTNDYKTLLASAAYGTSASLERIVDSLESLFGINTTLLATGNLNRNDLFASY